ncbi:MAG TPA: hypothetical protein P5555_02410 [Candidatus Paceibacterota bacterium]|nr:hypothetical protein [Verrucomicrobiota bacterium]HOX01126.1 hypothetical protein [Verrucomicrobiota bacterium]HRZ44026.1 hypothetical protein [Candidatus Paceibacterota bacterium]HRZ94369.1 hypothetical protein [Candidatus Paceibacterota bacterium]
MNRDAIERLKKRVPSPHDWQTTDEVEVNRRFDKNGRWQGESPEDTVEDLKRLAGTKLPALRVSQEVAPRLEDRRQAAQRKALRKEYELKVQRKEWPDQETLVPLFPYQREGMLPQAARLLGDGGLEAEAAAAAAEAALALGRAIAIEHRVPEPAGLPEIALPPLAHLWKNALPAIQGLAANATAAWRPAVAALAEFLSETRNQAPSACQAAPQPAAASL